MKSRYKIAALPLVVGLMASPLLANCSAVNGALGAAGVESPDCSEELKTGNFANVKADAGVKGFLDASSKFKGAVDKMEVDLIASCAELGKGIGMKEDELKADPGDGKGSEKVCGAVAAKVQGIIKANADATLTVEITPPSCGADVDVMMDCFKDCGSPIKPGELKASCEGGEISGKCEADCQGSCTVEAGAECKGTCSGSCEGSCDANFSGTCGGDCNGKCDGKDSKGKCSGQCEGKCSANAKGSCSGKCEGKCDASCEVKGQAKCSGECHGGCSAEIKAPKCSGEFKPPSVSVDCQAKCAAKAAASLTCNPPGVRVIAKGKGAVNTDVTALVSSLRVSLPKIIKLQLGSAKALGKAGVQLVTQIKGAANGVASAGIHTAGCMTMAVEQTVSAAAAIDVNVKASVNVSGSISGGGSAGGSAGAKTIETTEE